MDIRVQHSYTDRRQYSRVYGRDDSAVLLAACFLFGLPLFNSGRLLRRERRLFGLLRPLDVPPISRPCCFDTDIVPPWQCIARPESRICIKNVYGHTESVRRTPGARTSARIYIFIYYDKNFPSIFSNYPRGASNLYLLPARGTFFTFESLYFLFFSDISPLTTFSSSAQCFFSITTTTAIFVLPRCFGRECFKLLECILRNIQITQMEGINVSYALRIYER